MANSTRSRRTRNSDLFRRCKVAPSSDCKNSAFALVAALRAKGLSLLLVPRQRLFYYFHCRIRWANIIHLYLLAFQLLVILEKTLQNQQAMRRQFVRFDIAVEFRIVGGHGDDLVVARSGIDHGHQANGPRFDERQWLYRLLAQIGDIERVVIVRIGLRDESIV